MKDDFDWMPRIYFYKFCALLMHPLSLSLSLGTDWSGPGPSSAVLSRTGWRWLWVILLFVFHYLPQHVTELHLMRRFLFFICSISLASNNYGTCKWICFYLHMHINDELWHLFACDACIVLPLHSLASNFALLFPYRMTVHIKGGCFSWPFIFLQTTLSNHLRQE